MSDSLENSPPDPPEIPVDPAVTAEFFKVEGVVVPYVESMYSVQLTVEGDLPEGAAKSLAADLLDKVTKLENTRCTLIAL
jgi:hypothetical protein